MGNTINRYIRKTTAQTRSDMLFLYKEKIFNLWLGSWRWKGITPDQREYIMRKLWRDGTVAAFPVINPKDTFLGAPLGEDGLIGFAPYSVQAFNMYNAPSRINLINERGVPYIPNKPLTVNQDAVIGYAQHSRTSVERVINPTVERIVDVEMTIRTNLIAAKSPYLYAFTPDSDIQGSEFISALLDDVPVLGVSVQQSDALRAAPSPSNYIIDRLYSYKVALENEIHTFLGIDNIGMVEKKEHLLDDEIDSNQSIVNDFSDSIGDCLKEFAEAVKDVLGFDVSVEAANSPAAAMKEEQKEGGEQDGNANADDLRSQRG